MRVRESVCEREREGGREVGRVCGSEKQGACVRVCARELERVCE